MREDLRARIKQAFAEDIEPASPQFARQVFASIPVGIATAPGLLGWLHRAVQYVVKHWLTTSVIGIGSVAILGYLLVSRTPDVALFVGYADSRAQSAGLPDPWAGAPNVAFKGASAPFDAGAIRIDNRSEGEVTIDDVSVDVGTTHFALWGGGIRIPGQGILILTQTRIVQATPLQTDFDTSDVKTKSCDVVTATVPIIHLTVNGHRLEFADRHLVLTAGGRDLGNCPGNPSESHAWEELRR